MHWTILLTINTSHIPERKKNCFQSLICPKTQELRAKSCLHTSELISCMLEFFHERNLLSIHNIIISCFKQHSSCLQYMPLSLNINLNFPHIWQVFLDVHVLLITNWKSKFKNFWTFVYDCPKTCYLVGELGSTGIIRNMNLGVWQLDTGSIKNKKN